tara:strand:+ start:12822 stop:13079 length:258 start_codon:yes stop_codon:yes gene_type:complete
MSITPKSKDKNTEKTLKRLNRKVQETPPIEFRTGSLSSSNLNDGEFAFSVVGKDSELPGSPSTDEGRLYFKVDGSLYKLTGIKVG